MRYSRGLIAVLVAVLTLGCAASEEDALDVAVAVETNDGTTYLLIAAMSGGGLASATVTVNGETFDVDFLLFTPLLTPVGAGDTVDVQVTSSKGSASASLLMPGAPSVTSPNGSVNPASAIGVTWTRNTPYPQQYIVKVGSFDTASGEDYEGLEAGTSTNHTIPAYTLAAGRVGSEIIVGGMSRTALGGDLSGQSELTVINSVDVSVDT